MKFSFSQNEVKFMWSGDVTYKSVKVNAKLSHASPDVQLVVSPDSAFSAPDFSISYTVDSTTNYMASLEIDNLLPLTKYYYAIRSDGVIDASTEDIGSFTTFANGPFSYSFAIGSCGWSSNHKVFDVMRNMNPDFFIDMGDLHYSDPNSGTDINVHRWPYEGVLTQARLVRFLKQTPIVYVWDDHDFSGNDSDSSSAGKQNARQAYHEYVPHYPLAFGPGPWNPIAQAFTAGRVRFILTDLRSERYAGQVMKPSQLAWFESECLYARDNDLMIAWMSTYSWSGTGSDNWAAYSSDRTLINDFFYCNNIKNLFIMSGDAHMLGIDDGTNADFSTGACPGYKYPIFQAAALNQNGSYKGGTYNQGGYFPNPSFYTGQFGKVKVTDSGADSICITFEGYRVDSSGASVTLIDSYTFCRDLTITAIASNEYVYSADIQPNPSGNLNIHFSQPETVKQVRVYNIAGKLEKIYKGNSNLADHFFSAVDLKAGSYIVEIETEKGRIKKHWIKI